MSVDAVVGAAVDLTPLVLSAGQVSAAARCVARMCPDDRAVILAALGLLRDGRICAPPAPHGAVLLDTSPVVG